ncbi:permease [Succinatimonas hippei]|uniref:permease n=1 Tax=Succinatimonas hippei TaxID=626938 RepID=UPI0025A39E91|nr:permease [Succinatimonas hippei]MDM8119878.1 permease [Succinatimonas hippei]
MYDFIEREIIYLWYYLDILCRQIVPFYIIGTLLGSAISVFVKDKIHALLVRSKLKKFGFLGYIPAALLGFASPICMYGTIPLVVAFYQKGVRQDFLACFMVASILLNPQLIAYSAALGPLVFFLRILTCFLMALSAGLLIRFCFKNKEFFIFTSFGVGHNHDTDPNLFIRYLKNVGRNLKATLPYFAAGILLAALFTIHVPQDAFSELFGKNNGIGVLLSATLGVPLYLCGGGTVPILISWLSSGMSCGAAVAFMLSGPATKLTNITALKSILGLKHFIYYIAFVMIFAAVSGLLTDACLFIVNSGA